MNLLKSVYQDANGNTWVVERQSIQNINKRGAYVYWIGECTETNQSYRDTLKRKVINHIKTIKKTSNGTSNQLQQKD